MVSTRGIKYRFCEGERVLCYEPDPTKAKVLYDSKVLGIVETKDKRGKKQVQYKIHFQGWNSSWDRRVNSDFVLKDTDENRQLQKDLAEKAQLQLAAYLYRREKRKRTRTEGSSNLRNRGSSEDGSSCSTFERNDRDYLMRDECDSESCSSSIESAYDEDRLYLQIGDKLKQYLNYDREMIVRNNKQHILPSKLPAVTILENFVKHSALKLVFSSSPNEAARRRNSQLRSERREMNFEKLNNTVSLLKEVADGLRVYLDFILKDHLLYKEEKEQGHFILSEENLQNFTYIASQKLCPDFLNPKSESIETPAGSEISEPQASTSDGQHLEENAARRRLRSFRNEETDSAIDCAGSIKQDNCFSSVASTSSGGSTPHSAMISTNLDFMKTIPPLNSSVSLKTREFLQGVFSWQILPSNAPAEASMIYGAVHLARLVIKLPDFLNATHMSDEKLAVLAPMLDSFFKYLESHKEWFGEHNYKDGSNVPTPTSVAPPTVTTSTAITAATPTSVSVHPTAGIASTAPPLVSSSTKLPQKTQSAQTTTDKQKHPNH